MNLKPCPFCGSEYQAEHKRWNEWTNRIECNSCYCRTEHFATKKEAYEVWNNRPIEDKLQAELEEKDETHKHLLTVIAGKNEEITRLRDEILQAIDDDDKTEFERLIVIAEILKG